MKEVDKLFSPRSVAIVGASDDRSRPGGRGIDAMMSNGYKGRILPVHPRLKEVQGLRCYASVMDIDGDIDLAVIALPAPVVVDIVSELGARGIPNAIVLGAGFRESGPEGAVLQEKLVENARRAGVRLVGPNCLGVANIHERMFAAFGSLSRPPLLRPGPVSMVMQSGGFGNSLAYACHAAGVGFRVLVSSGNEADLKAAELMDALVDDERTEIILAYLEGADDGRAIMAMGERAMARGKPVLVWKAGNTRQGIRSAATHTANMTGTYDVWRAALRQSGIIEVQSMDEAADFVKALTPRRYPRGRNTAVVTASGGAAVIYADAADHYGLELQAPAAATRAVLEEAFPKAATLQNPVDLAANGFGEASQPGYELAVEALLKDPGVDQICPMFSAMTGHPMKLMADVLARIFLRSDKPMIAFSSVPREVAHEAFQVLEEAGIPVLGSPNGVVRAQAMLADYSAMRARLLTRTSAASPVPAADVDIAQGNVLDEVQSKRIIAAWLPVTQDVVVSSVDASELATLEVSFPVAVKIVSPDIAHKTDVGGVVLHVQDREALKTAWDTVISNARRHMPQAKLTGVLVSEMIADGVETLVGIVDDEVFGPVVACGMGGVLAEVLRDVSYRVAPFDEQEARDMIRELRAWPVFEGVRGKPPADVAALAQALVKVSHFAWVRRDTVCEVDINPLLVRPVTRKQGKGVIAADAMVILRRA
jgi:acetyltransferase